MKRLELEKATAPLRNYARDVKKEPVVLTSGGKPVAALFAITNADLETITLSTHPQFIALIERSRMRQKAGGGISSKEVRRRLGIERTGRHR
jgi:antitoxin (DNA-binding transcriptional repressor) of toxin-antitoxin stability system